MTSTASLQLGQLNGDLPPPPASMMSEAPAPGKSRKKVEEIAEPPSFVRPIEGAGRVPEGETVHLETSFQPTSDNTLQVEWMKDGVPVSAGSRFNTYMDRGYAVLDILYTLKEDSGNYTCVARSNSGTAETSPASVSVEEEAVEALSQQQEQTMAHIADLEASWTNPKHGLDGKEERVPKVAPTFNSQLQSQEGLTENEPARFEARVEPHADPNLTVDWFKNGELLSSSCRFNVIFDRGFAILDIAYTYPEDSGEYFCVAKNAYGQAQSNVVQLTCAGGESILTGSHLPEDSVNHLKRLDDPGDEYARGYDGDQNTEAPTLASELSPPQLTIREGGPARFEVKILAGSGDKLQVDWFKDGERVQTGSRILGLCELGTVALVFQYVFPEDSGQYYCVVSTEFGQVQSNAVGLQCSAEASIITSSQLPGDAEQGILAIQQLEDVLNRPRENQYVYSEVVDPPRFVKELNQPSGTLAESHPVSFDVRVEPRDDNAMDVEWFKDGEQVTQGSRFKLDYDRGYARLDILYTITEDSGEYWCVARNKLGQAESNHVTVQCEMGAGIVTDSQMPAGSDGFRRIKAMEDEWHQTREDEENFRNREEEEEECAPRFDVQPQPLVTGYGMSARFLIKLTGTPRPSICWFLDDEPVDLNDNNFRVANDGAINYLELHRCQELGEIRVKAVATSAIGEAATETTLTVVPMEDFRPGLKHVKRENPYRKMMELRQVERSEELKGALHKPKATAERLREVERGSEMKAMTFKSPDVVQAEDLYTQVQSGLRSSERNRPKPSGVNMSAPAPKASAVSAANTVHIEQGSDEIATEATIDLAE